MLEARPKWPRPTELGMAEASPDVASAIEAASLASKAREAASPYNPAKSPLPL